MNLQVLHSFSGRGLFVTGTDTGVGKTFVSRLLVQAFVQQGLRVVAMKPVAAGVEADGQNEDVRQLLAASNVKAPLQDVNPYVFAPPIAPHIAACQAGVALDLQRIADSYGRLSQLADRVVVEGAGGLLVPLDAEHDMRDIPLKLHLPVLLVVGVRLGCLNHALLTVEAIQARGLALAGWVANVLDAQMPVLEENIQALTQRIPAHCWGRVDWQGG